MSGEARQFEDLSRFQPENGAILANATPIGMHPNTERIPVAEVINLTIKRFFYFHLIFTN